MQATGAQVQQTRPTQPVSVPPAVAQRIRNVDAVSAFRRILDAYQMLDKASFQVYLFMSNGDILIVFRDTVNLKLGNQDYYMLYKYVGTAEGEPPKEKEPNKCLALVVYKKEDKTYTYTYPEFKINNSDPKGNEQFSKAEIQHRHIHENISPKPKTVYNLLPNSTLEAVPQNPARMFPLSSSQAAPKAPQQPVIDLPYELKASVINFCNIINNPAPAPAQAAPAQAVPAPAAPAQAAPAQAGGKYKKTPRTVLYKSRWHKVYKQGRSSFVKHNGGYVRV